MKASIKLRDEELKPPLLRAKLPVSILGLPFISSAAGGDPHDLSFHLRSALPSGPSLKLSYHPNPDPNPDPNPNPNPRSSPFSISLKSGIGLFGSPFNSPLIFYAHLSAQSGLSFNLHFKPRLGDFTLKNASISSPSPNPNPKLADLVAGGAGVAATTTLPVGRRVAVSVRWGVNLPEDGMRRLPYLTVDKISLEPLETEKEREVDKKKGSELGERDLEMMKGMCFWMGREVEEIRKENLLIKESVDAMRKRVSGPEVQRNDGNASGNRKRDLGLAKDGSIAGTGAARTAAASSKS